MYALLNLPLSLFTEVSLSDDPYYVSLPGYSSPVFINLSFSILKNFRHVLACGGLPTKKSIFMHVNQLDGCNKNFAWS